jgi:hypothetical protein
MGGGYADMRVVFKKIDGLNSRFTHDPQYESVNPKIHSL